jgi:hypothetical protein
MRRFLFKCMIAERTAALEQFLRVRQAASVS